MKISEPKNTEIEKKDLKDEYNRMERTERRITELEERIIQTDPI